MNALTPLASSGIVVYALNLLLHLTVICLGVLVAARLLFRRDPAARHLLCLVGLICVLLVPAAIGLETKFGGSLFQLTLPGAEVAAPVAADTDLPLAYTERPYRVAIHPAMQAPSPAILGGWALGAAYLLGVSWGALRFVHGCRRVVRLKRNISPWREASAGATLHAVAQALHTPVPPVFTSRHIASPIAVGLLRPAVILPEGLAETLTPRQLRHVLLHECAHVTFRHGLGGLLERIAGVLFWPHPLVRLLCRELACAREEMCDNVASQEDGAACYARTLLLIAQGIDRAPNLASTLALLGTGTSLEARIAGLLDPRRNRMVFVKRWKLWAVTGASVVAMASTASLRVVAAQDSPGQNPGGAQAGSSVITRVFAFQFEDANQAAEYLRNALTPEQQAQINLVVDSRTNSLIVQSTDVQMAGIATFFGRLELLAEQARAKPEVTPVPPAQGQVVAKSLAGAIASAPGSAIQVPAPITPPAQNRVSAQKTVSARTPAVTTAKSRVQSIARTSTSKTAAAKPTKTNLKVSFTDAASRTMAGFTTKYSVKLDKPASDGNSVTVKTLQGTVLKYRVNLQTSDKVPFGVPLNKMGTYQSIPDRGSKSATAKKSVILSDRIDLMLAESDKVALLNKVVQDTLTQNDKALIEMQQREIQMRGAAIYLGGQEAVKVDQDRLDQKRKAEATQNQAFSKVMLDKSIRVSLDLKKQQDIALYQDAVVQLKAAESAKIDAAVRAKMEAADRAKIEADTRAKQEAYERAKAKSDASKGFLYWLGSKF